ncbi:MULTISPECIES: hypothetical protein [Cyanophyceae]|uniref:hypothetical protein n=1 Tax=Cyanophyceae TaxID=3028117 RepID=UPI00168A1375|nr:MULTISPECIES: hypothetical protein [Cyanophyceae]MBD1917186.1 hypothetical protein [Phormidium sp. FACHB-77]MBD2030717.1 hypothetical protein [Phormidium sp. FACHB-322]MBD2050175.1 hypothetical protein [Leptolyngbya sp. FACHB-60]
MAKPTKRPLKAITFHRPWAYAIAHLGKDIENRSWACPLATGSVIAIHAGLKYDRQSADWLRQNIGLGCPPDGSEHPTGIVAIARFVGNVTSSDSPWFRGPIGWRLADVVAIPAVPCSGKQRLWLVPDELMPSIRLAHYRAKYKNQIEGRYDREN